MLPFNFFIGYRKLTSASTLEKKKKKKLETKREMRSLLMKKKYKHSVTMIYMKMGYEQRGGYGNNMNQKS